MNTIYLLNMPFADISTPSLALHQLKAVTDPILLGRAGIEILDLNQEFAQRIGLDVYYNIANSLKALYAGFGDWYFRQVAFTETQDNTDNYMKRFLSSKDEVSLQMKSLALTERPFLASYVDEIIGRYHLADAWLVGFTSMFMQTVPSIAIARMLKQRNPGVITVIGGANCEYPMGSVIAKRVQWFDYVFSGPALKSFPDLVGHLLSGDASGHTSIPGVLHQQTADSKPSSEWFGQDLDINTPLKVDYDRFIDHFETNFRSTNIKPSLPFETSRGCWWGQRAHCTFCGLNGESMAYRAMAPQLARNQFDRLFRHAPRVTRLVAVDNILPRPYIKDVLPYLDTPHGVEIFYEVKADLSEDELKTLVRAGVVRIQPGIESLATPTLKLMKKGTTAYHNAQFLKTCTLLNITISWNLLVGFPGEDPKTYEVYAKLIPLLTHLYPPSGVFPVRFDRFSPYYKQSDDYNLDLQPLDFYSYVYPFSESELGKLAYYFSDRNILAEYQRNMIEQLDNLTSLVNIWKTRWHDDVKPKLYFSGGGPEIVDSRGGQVRRLTVDKTENALLKALSRPLTLRELGRMSDFRSSDGIEDALESLESQGLVFKEEERLLSLVMEFDPDIRTTRDISEFARGVVKNQPFPIIS